MFLTPVRPSVPLDVSLDTTEVDFEGDDAILDYHSELVAETREKKRIRLSKIDMSNKLARAKLRKSYQLKLMELTNTQRSEIKLLADQWRQAHAEAELAEANSADQTTESARLFTLCGNHAAANKLTCSPSTSNHVKNCDSAYTRIMQRLLVRHQSELDWLKSAFKDELELSQEEHDLMNHQINNQFQIETAENITEMVKYISSTNKSPSDKARLIKTVSPRKQMRVGKRCECKDDLLCTPVMKRVRTVPNTQ